MREGRILLARLGQAARTDRSEGGRAGAVPACLLPPGPLPAAVCGGAEIKKVAFDAMGIVFTLFLPLSDWQLVLLCLF